MSVVRPLVRHRIAVVVALCLLLLVTASGCAKSPRQTSVSRPGQASADETSTLSPLERGAVRSEALDAAQAALDAWFANDLPAIRVAYADQQYDHFVELDETYAKEGKVRVRSHEPTFLDVVDMNQYGTEVSIVYRFKDNSYFASAEGERLTQPAGDEADIRLGLVKMGDRWIVVRMIAGPDRLQ